MCLLKYSRIDSVVDLVAHLFMYCFMYVSVGLLLLICVCIYVFMHTYILYNTWKDKLVCF